MERNLFKEIKEGFDALALSHDMRETLDQILKTLKDGGYEINLVPLTDGCGAIEESDFAWDDVDREFYQ